MWNLLACNLLILLTLVSFSVTAASEAEPRQNSPLMVSEKIRFWRRSLIAKDLLFLKEVAAWENFSDNDKKETDIEAGNYAALIDWLTKRISKIIPANTSLVPSTDSSELLEGNLSYPNAIVYPENIHKMFLVQDHNSQTMMANLGTSYYLLGKQINQVVSLDLQEHFPSHIQEKTAILSPRIGLLEVYPSFFKRRNSLTGKGDYPADRILRLSYLFHEGRHSDGNHASLGFFHQKCPAGHDYAGRFACDTPSNGSYKVSAVFIKNTLEACGSCSEANKEALRLAYFDARNRILDRPILRAQEVEELNNLENELNNVINTFMSNLEQKTDAQKNLLLEQIEGIEERIHALKNPEDPKQNDKVYWNSAPEALK